MSNKIKTAKHWRIRKVTSPITHKEMWSLIDTDGVPIWPVGLGYVNHREMIQHEEGLWKFFPKAFRVNRHKAALVDLMQRAKFDFCSTMSANDMNSHYPGLCMPLSVQYARMGKYTSQERHAEEYPGEPWVDGQGRVPVDHDVLHQEVLDIMDKWDPPALNLNEFLWASMKWPGHRFDIAADEFLASVRTMRRAAPEIPIIWTHAFTKFKDGNYWTEANLKMVFEEFYKAGGSMITINWYPPSKTPPAPTDVRFSWLQNTPSGWSEFAHLSFSTFKQDVEWSQRGQRSLARAGKTEVTPESEYVYPRSESWEDRLLRLGNYLNTCALIPDCIFAAPYGGVDHVEMAWGHLFNPYTWEEYPVDEIGALVAHAKHLREVTFGLGI